MLARAFLAVYPSAPARDALARVLAPLHGADELRWERPDQWHVTLRFLGRLDAEGTLVRQLTPVCARIAPFAVQLRGGGAFARPARATVLWCGVDDGGRLVDLATAVGYDEQRPFRPHLTVARRARPGSVRDCVDAMGDARIGPPFEVDRVALMASDTRPEGARHRLVASVPLRGGG